MRSRLGVILAAAGLTVTAAMTLGGTATASTAASTGSWESFSYVVGDAHFLRMGRVPGQPGNAHSGNAAFDTSDDPVVGYLYDWSCPTDGRPVTFWDIQGPAYNDTTCTLLRSRYFDGGQGTVQMPTFSGPLAASYDDTIPFYDDYPTYNGTESDGRVQFRWTRTGPITRTIRRESVDDYYSILTAPMSVTGRVGWLRLDDPRVETRVDEVRRVTEYYRAP